MTNTPQFQGLHCAMCKETAKKEENGKILNIYQTNTLCTFEMHI